MFIDEEYRNLKVVINGGELPRNVNQKKKSNVLQDYVVYSVTNVVHSVTDVVAESISSVTVWDIVNQ